MWYSGDDGTNFRGYYATLNAGITGSTAVTPGWHHIVGAKNGSGVLTLYVDGAQVATGTTSVPSVSNGAGLVIGDLFSGIIDEVLVYNQEISASEVSERFNNP